MYISTQKIESSQHQYLIYLYFQIYGLLQNFSYNLWVHIIRKTSIFFMITIVFYYTSSHYGFEINKNIKIYNTNEAEKFIFMSAIIWQDYFIFIYNSDIYMLLEWKKREKRNCIALPSSHPYIKSLTLQRGLNILHSNACLSHRLNEYSSITTNIAWN